MSCWSSLWRANANVYVPLGILAAVCSRDPQERWTILTSDADGKNTATGPPPLPATGAKAPSLAEGVMVNATTDRNLSQAIEVFRKMMVVFHNDTSDILSELQKVLVGIENIGGGWEINRISASQSTHWLPGSATLPASWKAAHCRGKHPEQPGSDRQQRTWSTSTRGLLSSFPIKMTNWGAFCNPINSDGT